MNAVKIIDRYVGPAIIIIAIIIASVSALVYSFTNHDTTITFNVTGVDVENINASSVVGLQYDCIQFCSEKFANEFSKIQICYEECERLGRCAE